MCKTLSLGLIFFIIFSVYHVEIINAQIEGIYCGKENCYSVLGVTRDDDKATITRAYRRMAKIHHPDRQKTEETRKEAAESFKKIALAYEILRDEEQKAEYDYMLDNPEAMYYHYYSYFRRRLSPQVDVRIVLFVFLTLFSFAQYYMQWSGYNEALDYLVKQQRYRNEAKEYAKLNGLLDEINKKKDKSGRRPSKDNLRQQEEKILREIIANKLNIKPFEVKRGSFYRPSIKHTIWVQMFTKPMELFLYLRDWLRWIVVYWILRRSFTEEDKLEQIRWYFGTSKEVWQHASDEEKRFYLKKELWKKENYTIYADKVAEEERLRLIDDPKYKRYQRLMRKGGPGQIVFGPDDVDFDSM